MSQESFRALGVSAGLSEALAAREFDTPFPIQELFIPDALAGRDVLAKAPTGAGKTLAFGLPVVQRTSPEDGTPSVLVLVLTRELAGQVAGELQLLAKTKGLPPPAVYGGGRPPAPARPP